MTTHDDQAARAGDGNLPPLPEAEYLLAIDDGEHELPHVTSMDGYTEEQMRAYAMAALAGAESPLTAAAPVLLQALQFVMSAHGEQLDLAFQQAQDAIAKATGIQSHAAVARPE